MHFLEKLKSFNDQGSQLAAARPSRERSQGTGFKFQVFSDSLRNCGKIFLSFLPGLSQRTVNGKRKEEKITM